MRSRAVLVAILTAFVPAVISQGGAGASETPRPRSGAAVERARPPYGVGTVSTTLVDTTRPTPPRAGTPGAPTRTLPVTIRYPTARSTDRDVVNARPMHKRFPLVVFAHGYASAAHWYGALLQELAAAGFVVAAPDFPVSSVAFPGPPLRDPIEQATDVSFVISALQDGASAPPLLGPVGIGRPVGVAGQSDGGVTAAGVAYNDGYADPRIGGAAVLTGAQSFFPGAWFTNASPPFLAIHGDVDETNPFRASERLYAGAKSPKWLVRVADGRHLDPFTVDPVRPEISGLIADFFRASLRGNPRAATRIADAATTSARLDVVAHE